MSIPKVLNVPNISCHHCVHTIQRELSPLPGVKKVEADLQFRQVTLTLEDNAALTRVLDTLKEIGYPAE